MAGKFVPICELGQSPLGTQFLGACHGPGDYFILLTYTRLHEALPDSAALFALAFDELRVVARLNHPNVEQVFDLGADEGGHYVVSEYREGLSLEALFERGGRAIATEVYLRVLADALTGLHYAHELSDDEGRPLDVVHRDLAAERVFVTCRGETKVLDFGIAAVAGALRHEHAGEIERRIAYLAPEQLRAAPEASRRGVDVFAAGALLYRILSGRRPWEGQSWSEIAEHLAGGRVPSVRAAAPHAPAELVAICDKARAPDPRDRYPTALAFRQAIERYLERSGVRPTHERIGLVVAELGADDRARVRAAVEEYLREHGIDLGSGFGVGGAGAAEKGAPAAPAEPHGHPYRGSARGEARGAGPRSEAGSRPAGRAGLPAWGGMTIAVVAIAFVAAWLAR
ncbi:MAG TPA: serine/threonine-protein kinase [Polyangiaceae bacterium]|nr:serine/threonine-protein kinase [Polyangiaceae bacterium]